MKVVFNPTIDGQSLVGRIANDIVTGELMQKKVSHVLMTEDEFLALPYANRAWVENRQRIFVYGEHRVPIEISPV